MLTMKLRLLRNGRRAMGVSAGAIGLIVALAAPAMAHTPVILDSHDVVPWTSPLILDGTDPVTLFGVLPHCFSVRSAQFKMQAGQQISLSYGIPDEAPESQLPQSSLPEMLLVAPDHSATVLSPNTRVTITPESGMPITLVRQYSATAEAGTYSIVMLSGCAPERFVAVLGMDPGDFDGVARGSVATPEQVADWFSTPPPQGHDSPAIPSHP
jgi:hypothetical protein